MDTKDRIVAFIEEHRDDFIRVSDGIWDAAELAMREYKSARLLIDELERHDFSITTGIAGIPTAFEAKWGNGKPVIGICGEFDALPGLSQEAGNWERKPIQEGGAGHGCMHNLLGAAAMAAAIAVRHHMEEEGMPGTISFFGCPGEEGGCGKVFMARVGAFDHLDAALSWHPDDLSSPWSTGNSATVALDFHFHGTAAHASRFPHLGRSALDACELMNVGANYLREHKPPNTKILYNYEYAGTPRGGVVPDYACVRYSCGGANVTDTNELLARIIKVAQGAAMMTETRVEYKFLQGTCEYMPNLTLCRILSEAQKQVGPPLWDDEDRALAERMRSTMPMEQIRKRDPFMTGLPAEEVPDWVEENPLSNIVADMLESTAVVIPSSSDIGAVSYIVPCAQLAVSCKALGTVNHTWLTTAQGKCSIGHKGMLTAAKSLALGAVMILQQNANEDGNLLRRAKAELMKKTGCKLVLPIPDSVMPDVEEGVSL